MRWRRGRPSRSSVIHGGVAYGPQLDALSRGDEVIVATPGRLIDLQNRGKAKLKGVRILILDEADRMLDMGFRPQIEDVARGLGAKPQTLMFSATMPNAVHDLALRMTRDAAWVEVTPSGTMAQGISEVAYSVRPDKKPGLLIHLLEQPGWEQVPGLHPDQDRRGYLEIASRSGPDLLRRDPLGPADAAPNPRHRPLHRR